MNFLAMGLASLVFFACSSPSQDAVATKNSTQGDSKMQENTTFDSREVAIAKIGALSAASKIEELSAAMEDALASKTLNQNEVGEICLQLYAYAGFPRSLNAQGALAVVVKSLEEKGVAFDKGVEPAPVPSERRYDNGREVINGIFGTNAKQGRPENNGYEATTDVFLKEHLFNDITSRKNLSVKDRELATASMLAALQNVNPQLGAHISGALHTGTKAEDLRKTWLPLLAEAISFSAAGNAENILNAVTKSTDKASFKMDRKEFETLDPFGVGMPNTMYAKYFIGESYLKPLTDFQNGAFPVFNVTFEPGCRNNWHIHHATKGGGQVLICTAGEGWYQEEGKPAVSLTPGTVIYIPANVKHWHGAKKDSWFSHVTFEPAGEKTSNEWLEPVSDEEYSKL